MGGIELGDAMREGMEALSDRTNTTNLYRAWGVAIYENTAGASGVVDSINYKGTWNCSGGTYPITPGKGYAYVCSVAGTISGTSYRVNDWLVYNGTTWNKIIGNEAIVPVTSVNGQSGVIVLTLDDIANGVTYGRLTNTQVTDLTDTGDSALHYHSADRARAVHTGTQAASTISDFDTEVSNNTDVAANTLARHSAITVGDTASLDLILTGQALSGIVLPAGVDHDQLLNTHSKLIFKTISVSGQSDIVADSDTDTLSFSPSSGIALSTNATTDTLTVTNIDLGTVSRTAHELAYDHALLHSPVTVSDSLSIDLTLDGQNISGVVLPAGIDHNSLAGVVTGDVHTQYTLLAGRSGGQVIRGGTGSSENLVLNSTSHATQGKVLISGTVGINVNDPDTQLEIMSTSNQLKLSYDGTNNCAFGVDVSGDVTITTNGSGIIVPDNKILGIGTGKDGQLYSSSDHLYIKNTTVDKDIIFQCNDGGSNVEVFRVKGSVGAITVPNALYYSCTDTAGTARNTLGITSANHTHIRAVVGNMILENDYSDGDIIFKVNDGGVDTTMATFDGSESTFALKTGVGINEFSNDGTLGGNSDLAVPTEKAVKTYVDAQSASSGVVNEGVTATNISGIISGNGSLVTVAKNDAGAFIVSFSTDGTMGGNTDVDIPTEKAVKTYADTKIAKSILTEQGDILYASGASTPAALAHGTVGQHLISGGDSANPSWQTSPGFFGDGSDGNVTISGNTTLTKDMNYNNLTVNSSIVLSTAGFNTRVAGTLTINVSGVISCNGGDGITGANGGVAGGTPAYSLSRNYLSAPGAGGTGALAAAAGTNKGAAGAAGTWVVASFQAPIICFAGGGGGGGGNHAAVAVDGGAGVSAFNGAVLCGGGAGGAGSGTGSARLGGGSGGAGGGVMELRVNIINNAGLITSNGGNGGAGLTSGSDKSGNGGGGGGGIIIINYRSTTGSGVGTATCNGGLAGTGGNGGAAGVIGYAAAFQV